MKKTSYETSQNAGKKYESTEPTRIKTMTELKKLAEESAKINSRFNGIPLINGKKNMTEGENTLFALALLISAISILLAVLHIV